MIDDAPATPLCFACTIHRPAQLRLKIIPRRDLENPPEPIRRATAWPGAAEPCWLPICGRTACHDVIRSVAVSVLAAEALDGEHVVMRTVS